MLDQPGHDAEVAYDGNSALSLGHNYQPTVILSDLVFPETDGYQLAKRLRTELPHAILVALTGLGRQRDRQRSQEAGFLLHLVKPVAPELLKKLLTVLDQQAAKDMAAPIPYALSVTCEGLPAEPPFPAAAES